MKSRLVEMYIGLPDFTWYTDYIDIPIITAESEIPLVAYMECVKMCDENNIEAEFIGVYNIPKIKENEKSKDNSTV